MTKKHTVLLKNDEQPNLQYIVYNLLSSLRRLFSYSSKQKIRKVVLWQNIASIFIGILALSTACSFAFKVPSLYTFGQASGFSPMPTPFRDMGNGKESMHSTKKLFITEHGVKREDPTFLDVFIEESHVRPHRALIPYIGIGNFAEAIPYRLRERVLYRICSHFPTADTLTLEVTYDNEQTTRTTTPCRVP